MLGLMFCNGEEEWGVLTALESATVSGPTTFKDNGGGEEAESIAIKPSTKQTEGENYKNGAKEESV